MASSSEEGPKLGELSQALGAMAATRRNTKANNIALLDLIKGIKDDDEANSSSLPSSAKASKARDDLLEMGLLIIVKSCQSQNAGPAPSPFLPLLHSDPAPVFRRDFTSVRLYQEEVGGGKVALELIEADPSSPVNSAGKNHKIRHLNVVRDIMDFHEFKVLALKMGNLMSRPNDQLAVKTVLQSVEKMFEKNNKTWYLKPGTLLRCDVDHHGTIVASATFMSIPYVQADPVHESPEVTDRKGVCVPRRLDEIFHLHDSSQGSELFQMNGNLWVGETWMIILNDTGILTYGGKPCQDSLVNKIEIKEFEANNGHQRMVQVTEENGLQFQIPIAHCSTLMIMQTALQYQLDEMKPDTDTDENDYAIQSEASEEFTILGMNGEPMTSVVWSHLVHGQSPVLQVKLEPKPTSSAFGDSRDILPLYLSLEPDLSRVRQTAEWVHEQAREIRIERASQSIGSSFEEVDFAGIVRSISEDQHEDVDFRTSDLDAASRAIFTWGSTHENMDPDNGESDMTNSIKARFLRAEAYYRELVPGGLPQQEEASGSNAGTSSAENTCTLEMLKREVDDSMDQFLNPNGQIKGRFQEQKTLHGYHDFCKAAIHFLEAFIPHDVSSPGLHKVFSALCKGFKSPETRSRNQSPVKWTVLSGSGSLNEIRARTRNGSICFACLNDNIYMTLAKAFDHLRDDHYAELPPDEKLESHVMELTVASEEKLKEYYAIIVKMGRDMMMRIARAASEIQDAAVYADLIHHPSWAILSPLLESFELAVSFMFALSHALDETSKFFELTAHDGETHNLILGEDGLNSVGVMDRCGGNAEKTLRNIQRPLAALTHVVQAEDLVKLFVPVGVHELATHMACNLLTAPVHVSPNAVEPYKAVKEWQQQLLGKMHLLLPKDVHNARTTFAQVQGFRLREHMLDQAGKDLQDQPMIIASSLDDASGLMEAKELCDKITEFIDMMNNENALSFEIVFGTVYAIFLLGNFAMFQLSMFRLYAMEFTEQVTPRTMTPAFFSFFKTIAIFFMAIALSWYTKEWY